MASPRTNNGMRVAAAKRRLADAQRELARANRYVAVARAEVAACECALRALLITRKPASKAAAKCTPTTNPPPSRS
jgi:hypothetical protein